MPGNPLMEALMSTAGGQGAAPNTGGAGVGAMPAGTPPGAMGAGAAPGAGQGQPSGQPGTQPDPRELIVNGLLALQLGMSAMGGDESMTKVRQIVQKFIERMMKSTPQGQLGAAASASVPTRTPPGVGPMPGVPMM